MAQAIHLKTVRQSRAPWTVATFELVLEGFEPGSAVTVEVMEVDENNQAAVQQAERQLGTISGEVLQSSSSTQQYLVNTNATGDSHIGPSISITTDQTIASNQFFFDLPTTDADDKWTISIRLLGDPTVESNFCFVQRDRQNLPPTRATYPWHGQNLVNAFYNDGSVNSTGSAGYFHDLALAIGEARHFIFVVDWSFHPYFVFNRPSGQTIGRALIDWATRQTEGLAAIHTWDHTVGSGDGQNDSGESIFNSEMLKPGNMYWRMSSRTGENGAAGFGWSHHQKFVVMDCPCPGDSQSRRTIKAFLGGLDLTQGRFDWPEHPILPEDPAAAFFRRVTSSGRTVHDWYNAEFTSPTLSADRHSVLADNNRTTPRQPWHDIHCQVTGPVAWDLVREFVGRWSVDPVWHPNEAEGDTNAATITRVHNLFTSLFNRSRFVQQWEHHPLDGIWQGQILRSITSDHWRTATPINTPAQHPEFHWSITESRVRERSIQEMYLRMIARARNFIYIETQYFIGSGNQWPNGTRGGVANRIPKAIADKIIAKINENENFHVYLIIPYFPEGDPSSSVNQAQRDYQWNSIAVIIRAIEAVQSNSWQNYLTIGFLANWTHLPAALHNSGNRAERVCHNRRYMIYVHTKAMIVDDRYIIIGSANLNERSLAGGRDSEIGIGLWPEMTKGDQCRDMIRNLRRRLFLEHFGTLPAQWETPHLDPCRREIQTLGNNNWRLFNAGKHTSGTGAEAIAKRGHFCRWPIDGSTSGLGLRANSSFIIADGLTGAITGDDWFVWPTGYTRSGDLAE